MPLNVLESKSFIDISLPDLDALTRDQMDSLPYGVVGLTADNLVEVYNAAEAKWAGIPEGPVLGTNFFTNTAQCMNNYMVAQRFEDEEELDAVLDYVLTLRMRSTPVRLRLLKKPSARLRYILIQR